MSTRVTRSPSSCLLGALSLRKPRTEPPTGADKLLQHLASQAGLVLRNAQLTADRGQPGQQEASCGQ